VGEVGKKVINKGSDAVSMNSISRIRHPCFVEAMHSKVGRIHLPVAPKCNIHCNYCERRIGECFHAFRPGIAERVISPSQVVKYVSDALDEFPGCEVVGVAGPGEPLYNDATFESLRLVRDAFPGMKLCVCTNGLLLPENVDELKEIGVEFLTVTINADGPEVASRIYTHVRYKGRTLRGTEGMRLLVENQFMGLELAIKAGMEVKVNCVYIPGINDGSIPKIAGRVASMGARVMNVMPLIPCGKFSTREPPTCDELRAMRTACERYMPQFRLCKQCRADSCGIPGSRERFIGVERNEAI
jgi:nitrogen fixation protein NifB